jgi:hypothetical protein
VTFDPANPTIPNSLVIGLKTDNKTMLFAAYIIGEVPTEIFLTRFVGGLDALYTKLLYELPRYVVAKAAIVDEVLFGFRAVERSAVEVNLGFHGYLR